MAVTSRAMSGRALSAQATAMVQKKKKKKGSPETSPLSSYRSRSKEKVEQSGIPLKALSVVVTADACRFCQDRKTIVDLDISSQPLVIAIPCGFSRLQAAPWSVFMVSSFVTCFFSFLPPDLLPKLFQILYNYSQHYGSTSICPKVQYKRGSCLEIFILLSRVN